MLYDKSFYTNMISQITIFLENENNYIHSIKCEDLNFSRVEFSELFNNKNVDSINFVYIE